MLTARYVYWQDGAEWLGYFEEFPDYLTQGESLPDLQEHLKALQSDLMGWKTPQMVGRVLRRLPGSAADPAGVESE